MNCEDFRNLIPELARGEAPADTAVTGALVHAESCPACDALLRDAERLTAGLHSLAERHRLDAAPPRVQAALLHAFRQQRASAPGLRRFGGASALRMQSGRKRWLTVSAVGLAAAALLAILLSGYRPGTSQTPEAAPRRTDRPTAPQRATWAEYAREGETEEQAAAAYIPLSADFDPSWLEGGAIVRVVLSRPALESLGVPVIAGADGHMLADMVISNDGTPEAIRVVDWPSAGTEY